MKEHLYKVVDTTAIGTIGVVMMDWLSSASAVLAFIYLVVRLYETETIQKIIARVRKKDQE